MFQQCPGRTARSIHHFLLAAAVVLGAAGPSLAATKQCTIELDVSSATELGALQLGIDYSGASDVGEIATGSCDVLPDGASDSSVNQAADTATIGWANEDGFDGPGAFATCTFVMPDVLATNPVAGDFAVTVEDASDYDVPANPANPAIQVVVGNCVASACDAEPATGCFASTVAGKSKISFKDDVKTIPASDVKDQGAFQMKSGPAVTGADFEDLLQAGKVVSWCVYEAGDLVASYDVPSGSANGWTGDSTKGYQFKGDVQGVSQIKLKAGAAGKSSVAVKGKSKLGNFSSPDLPLSGSIVSQLVIDGTSVHCFQAANDASAATKNEDAAFSVTGNP